jgi:hypothetical protein
VTLLALARSPGAFQDRLLDQKHPTLCFHCFEAQRWQSGGGVQSRVPGIIRDSAMLIISSCLYLRAGPEFYGLLLYIRGYLVQKQIKTMQRRAQPHDNTHCIQLCLRLTSTADPCTSPNPSKVVNRQGPITHHEAAAKIGTQTKTIRLLPQDVKRYPEA